MRPALLALAVPLLAACGQSGALYLPDKPAPPAAPPAEAPPPKPEAEKPDPETDAKKEPA